MVYIRADGNPVIGAGHIMRCISIAEALMDDGVRTEFLLADDTFVQMLNGRGISARVLNSEYDAMEQELDSIRRINSEQSAELCLVDSYHVTEGYLSALGQITKVAYLDDRMAFPYPVDYLINYNIYADRSEYLGLYQDTGKCPEFLLGCDYVPLRKEFCDVSIAERPGGRKVFLSSGGADPEHVELKLLQAILEQKERFEGYEFHFVVGAMNPDWPVLNNLARGKQNIILHRNVTQMSRLMLECDLAVSAAGSTLYELCACGLPIITYVTADNQIAGGEAFGQKGNAIYTGDIRENPSWVEDIFQALERVSGDHELVCGMSLQARGLVDGMGAFRIAEALTQEKKGK